MTTARLVPVTTEMDGEELDAADAWHLIRQHGVKEVLVGSFVRFRYGDGFTNSRALALQACLGVVPFLLAVTGLAADVDDDAWGRVIADTVRAVTPGGEGDDALAGAVTSGSEVSGEVAFTLGLLLAVVTMTTAMAQVERGSNRIYGIRRDRPAVAKYTRAAVLTALLAIPVGVGFALLVAGGPFGDAMVSEYGWSDGTHAVWRLVRWPAGFALVVVTVAVLLDHAPRRRQPALSWLALGAGIAVVLTMAATGGLALYVKFGASFGETYGPLAGIVALLLWSLMSSIALFFGVAVCAQLEALRARQPEPAEPDPGRPHREIVEERRWPASGSG